ncbi:anticodon-binding domain-containing protein [Cryomyces antarcticus]
MADGKRNNAAGKVATPKSGGLPMQDSLEALGKAIGARIQLTTAAPASTTLEGTLFTACQTTNLIAINVSPPSQKGAEYHVVPVSKIQTFQIVSLAEPDSATAVPTISRVDVSQLKKREEAKVKELKKKERARKEMLGRGVGKEGQDIFNALAKQFPGTRWAETSIIVLDAVKIDAPYRADDCKAPREQQKALAHVRKVVDGERRKMAARPGAVVATPSVGARKGG